MTSERKPRRRRSTQSDLGDEMLLRVFTLADYAVTPPDGKLYISGGGIDQMFLQSVPGSLGQLFLALRIRVPWHRTSEVLRLIVRALDADRVPIGPDPIAGATVEVGRAPGQRAGDELGINAVVPLRGLRVGRAGTIYFHVEVEGEPLGTLPLKVGQMPREHTSRSGDSPDLNR